VGDSVSTVTEKLHARLSETLGADGAGLVARLHKRVNYTLDPWVRE